MILQLLNNVASLSINQSFREFAAGQHLFVHAVHETVRIPIHNSSLSCLVHEIPYLDAYPIQSIGYTLLLYCLHVHMLPAHDQQIRIIGASLSEPHHVRSTVKSVFLLACLLEALPYMANLFKCKQALHQVHVVLAKHMDC